MATIRQIRRTMVNLARVRDDSIIEYNEINATKLAEAAADELNIDEVLDDPNHEIWDLSLDIAELYNKIHEQEIQNG